MIYRIFRLRSSRLARESSSIRITGIHKLQQIIGQHMFKKKMKGMAVVMMPQVAEFMEHDIVLKDLWKADEIQIQVDVCFGRAAAPVGRIVLDCHAVIDELISGCEFSKSSRKIFFSGTAHLFHLIR